MSSSLHLSGAYGGSEVGAMGGGMVGPPVIGNIVGGLVGEVVGADAVSKCGLDDKAKKVRGLVLKGWILWLVISECKKHVSFDH